MLLANREIHIIIMVMEHSPLVDILNEVVENVTA